MDVHIHQIPTIKNIALPLARQKGIIELDQKENLKAFVEIVTALAHLKEKDVRSVI